MIYKTTHAITGEIVHRDLPITIEQINNWKNGMLIQYAFPNLSDSEREFILTGLSDHEYDKLFDDSYYLDEYDDEPAF